MSCATTCQQPTPSLGTTTRQPPLSCGTTPQQPALFTLSRATTPQQPAPSGVAAAVSSQSTIPEQVAMPQETSPPVYPQCHLNNGVSAELQRADGDVILGESAGRGNAAEEIAAKGAVDQGKENVAPKKRSHDEPQMELIIGVWMVLVQSVLVWRRRFR